MQVIRVLWAEHGWLVIALGALGAAFGLVGLSLALTPT